MAKRGNKYGAKKTQCQHGHIHDSKREAARCDDLHILQATGQITNLRQQPVFKFEIDGRPVKMRNGHTAKLTADFQYREGGKSIVEDVKGFVVRDFPLRAAIFQALYPEHELRIVK